MINEIFNSVRSGDILRVTEILDADPSIVHTENSDGLTLLGFAAHYGQADAVKLLLEYGANVNALSHSKVSFIPSNTALHAALAGERNMDVIKLLLENDAKTDICDSNGHTCLHTAAFHDDNLEIIDILIEQGADVNAKTETGETALDLARDQGNQRVVDLLNRKGIT